LHAAGEAVQFLADVGPDVLALTAQLDQGLQVGKRARDLSFLGDFFFEALALAQEFLAAFGLAPEIGLGD